MDLIFGHFLGLVICSRSVADAACRYVHPKLLLARRSVLGRHDRRRHCHRALAESSSAQSRPSIDIGRLPVDVSGRGVDGRRPGLGEPVRRRRFKRTFGDLWSRRGTVIGCRDGVRSFTVAAGGMRRRTESRTRR